MTPHDGCHRAFLLLLSVKTGLKLSAVENLNPGCYWSAKPCFFLNIGRLINYHISGEGFKRLLETLCFRIYWWKKSVRGENYAWFCGSWFFFSKTFEIKDLFAQKSPRGIIKGYESEWKGSGVPEPVILKFAEWHSPPSWRLDSSATSVFDGSPFTTPEQRKWQRLSSKCFCLLKTVIDAERTLGEPNGELGLYLQGLTLQ